MPTRDELAHIVDRAERADWRPAAAPAPEALEQRQFLRLGAQRALVAHEDGLAVVSDDGIVGSVDSRCRDYLRLTDGIAVVSGVGPGQFLVAVDQHQRAVMISRSAANSTVQLRAPQTFDDAASQAWFFSGFALVAHCGLPPTDHDPPPEAGLVLYSVGDPRGGRGGPPSVRRLASNTEFHARLRVLPSADGLIVAKNFMDRLNEVGWCDWRLGETASWFDEDRVLDYLAPTDVARAGTNTHVLYAGSSRAVLASFPHAGANPRLVEVLVEGAMPSPLAWTKNNPPWRSHNSPYAAEAWTPLPGPDGRVALAPPGHLICYGPDGRVAWQYRRNGAAPARLVEGGILVEHDAALFVLDWGGRFRHVWSAPAPLTARPLFHLGSWYVATAEGLHRLR